VVYLATADDASLGGLAGAVVGGALDSALNPLAKVSKVTRLARAASKVLAKVPKARKALKRFTGGVHYSNGWRDSKGRFTNAPFSGRPVQGNLPRNECGMQLTPKSLARLAGMPLSARLTA
jgi:hypothetical protein